ncbi:glycosyltransferase [Patescibacteria group bacterium]|nr:glycosyltransferase [Patescibacteria group bacterium]
MISIIIVVKDDLSICRTLKQLTIISKTENAEIIVIDSSKGKLDFLRNKFSNVKWLSFSHKKRKEITIPEQRNLGLKTSIGSTIIFIDAGCSIKKSWLKELIQPLQDKKEYIVYGATKIVGSVWTQEKFLTKIYHRGYLSEAPTNNLAVRREVFNKIGLFDESFEYGSDVDLCWRAIEKGYRILYLPKAIISYLDTSFLHDVRRSFMYGRARIRLYKKYKKKILEIFNNELISIVYPLFIVLLPLSFLFRFYYLFLLIPMIKNIRNKPIQSVCCHLVYGLGILFELMLILIKQFNFR